ncbi:hypothetical protein BGZ98_000702 [Dissophora globulifera]|nr:hypothetical protein BGZ98_000702 [Dissophora globulifera]
MPPATIVKYDHHRVLRIQIDTKDQLDLLRMHERQLNLDYFSHHKVLGGHIDVRIAPEHFNDFEDLHLNYQVRIENLQTVLDTEAKENAIFQQKWEASRKNDEILDGKVLGNHLMENIDRVNAFASTASWFAGYHTYADHQTWLATQIRTHPKIAKSFSAGKTHQRRDQAGIIIGHGLNNVVLHGLQHSREWISGAVVEYLIDQLLKGTDSRVAGYLAKYTFHIIPIMNPDGFVVTQTSNRMHRKNAQSNGECLGTDTNRNWDCHWNEGGSSNDPCADDYHGPSAFSSPEAANIANYLKSLPNVVSYIDFHSYSQMWMTPYGHIDTPPRSYDSYLKPLADGAVDALQNVNGVSFTSGDIYNTIYPATGSSVDYAYTIGVGAPFAVELRDTGKHGFSLPASQIIPSGRETWAAFTYILDNLDIQ